MKHIKLYESFAESSSDIDSICKEYWVRGYTINPDRSIDVDSFDVCIDHIGLIEITLKFRNVSRDFDCGGNRLTSLEGCPERVGGNFWCGHNQLTSLEFCPKYVGGDFSFGNNNIRTFEFIPEYIGGDLVCDNNPVYELWNLFEDYSKIELFNDYDIIRGEGIILDRLNSFLQDIGKPIVEKVKGYINI